jgi:tripartite-type tricarboxylate transporter receptor subunit TctC
MTTRKNPRAPVATSACDDHRPGANRRRFVLAPAAAALASMFAPAAFAQSAPFPTRPIRFIVPFSAGSGVDVTSRYILRGMSERLGQNIVVENKVGAVGMIAMQELARSQPDGYTLGYANLAIGVSQWLVGKSGFSLAKDVTAIGGTTYAYNVLVVAPDLPVRNARELVDLVKSKPGGFSYGSGGSGTPAHLNGEIFRRANGLDVVHVPYKGLAPAVNDMARGDIHFMFGISTAMTAAVASGRIRAIAVAAPRRLAALPDVPTMEESGFHGNDVRSWAGFTAPAGTPEPIVARLHQALAETLRDPATVKFLETNGAEAAPMDPATFGALLVAETARWETFIRETGLKAE